MGRKPTNDPNLFAKGVFDLRGSVGTNRPVVMLVVMPVIVARDHACNNWLVIHAGVLYTAASSLLFGG